VETSTIESAEPSAIDTAEQSTTTPTRLATVRSTFGLALPVVEVSCASVLITAVYAGMAQVGFDWSRRLIERIWYHEAYNRMGLLPSGTEWADAIVLYVIFIPLVFCACFGIFKTLHELDGHGKIPLTAAVAPIVLYAGAACLAAGTGMIAGWPAMLILTIAVAVTMGSGACGLKFGPRLYGALRRRMAAPRMLWSGFLAIAPVSLLGIWWWWWGPNNIMVGAYQAGLYVAAVSIGAACAVISTGVRNKTGALVTGTLSIFPLFLINVLSVFIMPFLGPSQWILPLLAALALNAATVGALLCGSLFGYACLQKRHVLQVRERGRSRSDG
jgi:hypothetical protein